MKVVPSYNVGDEIEVTIRGKITYDSPYVDKLVSVEGGGEIRLRHDSIKSVTITKAPRSDDFPEGTYLKKVYKSLISSDKPRFDCYRKQGTKWVHVIDQVGLSYPDTKRSWESVLPALSNKDIKLFVLTPLEYDWEEI